MREHDLFEELRARGKFTESQTSGLMLQLAEAIHICHMHGIAHRDVKLSNITFPLPTSPEAIEQGKAEEEELQFHKEYRANQISCSPMQQLSGGNIKSPNISPGMASNSPFGFSSQDCPMPPSLHLDSSLSKLQHLARQRNTPPHAPIFIKLLDLGMAGFSDSNGMISGRCGTPGYVAPEVLKAGQDEKYPNNVDMFSLGVVAYTLLCGYEPFFGRNEHELMLVNKHIQFEFHSPEWDEISESAKDFISRTICPVDIRMTPSDAKQHPWLRQATHNSDMRMLGRMRNMVLKVGKPSQALSCSSHHYLGPKNKVKETHLPAQSAQNEPLEQPSTRPPISPLTSPQPT